MVTTLLSSSSDITEKLKKLVSKKIEETNNISVYQMKNKSFLLVVSDYPSSIVSLLRALSISDSAIFMLNNSISALDAELMLSLENSGISNCTVVYDEASDTASFDSLFAGTELVKSARVRIDGTQDIQVPKTDSTGIKYVSIDKHFLVKGIGSVMIGFVVSGQINKGDKMFLLPSLKEVIVKNIQLMDVDVPSASACSHAGLALNNATEKDMESNYAICGSSETSKLITGELKISKFYNRDVMSVKDAIIANGGEAFSGSIEKNGGAFNVRLNKPFIALKKKFVVADPSLPVGKNRIIGAFEIR